MTTVLDQLLEQAASGQDDLDNQWDLWIAAAAVGPDRALIVMRAMLLLRQGITWRAIILDRIIGIGQFRAALHMKIDGVRVENWGDCWRRFIVPCKVSPGDRVPMQIDERWFDSLESHVPVRPLTLVRGVRFNEGGYYTMYVFAKRTDDGEFNVISRGNRPAEVLRGVT